MGFRWKTGFDDSLRAQDAANNMQGYSPLAANGMQGYNPNNLFRGPAPVGAGGDGANYQFDSTSIDAYTRQQDDLNAKRQQLAQLQAQLADIDAQIAKLDRENPNIKDSQAWEIAAKRAEAGDMSAYDNLVSRGSGNAGNVGSIANDLNNVENKLSFLKSDDSETQEFVKQQAKVALINAKEWADKTGGELPSSYYRVKEALDNADSVGPNANTIEGMLWTKMQNGDLTEADRVYAKALHDADPNSKDAPKLREIFEGTKGKTKEAKAASDKAKANAKALYDSIANLPLNQQFDVFRRWTDKQRELFRKYYKMDAKTGAGVK